MIDTPNSKMVAELIQLSVEFHRKFHEELFTPKQAAMLLECSVAALQKMRDEGRGPPYYKSNFARVFYKIDDLREYMLNRLARVEPDPTKTEKDITPA